MLARTLMTASVTLLAGTLSAQSLEPSSWLFLPAVGANSETGFQYGVYAIHQFAQNDINTPADRLELLLQGTSKGQFQAFVRPNVFLQGGDWNITGHLGARYWPTRYFGKSNDTQLDAESEVYELTGFDGEVGASYRVYTNIRLGILAFADVERIGDDPDSALLNSSVRGFKGGFYSGLGVFATLDTRDNRDWPTQGSYVYAEGRQALELLGSDANFGGYTVLGRQYVAVGNDVLALALNYEYGCITTPFTRLPRPDGSTSLRGADGNLWSDHHMLGTQAEYRATLTDRWAMTGFFDTAQVSDSLDGFGIDRAHTSLGVGIRYATQPNTRFNVRVDFGWIDFDGLGFAISVGEAF